MLYKIGMFIVQDCLPCFIGGMIMIGAILLIDKINIWVDEKFPPKDDEDEY